MLKTSKYLWVYSSVNLSRLTVEKRQSSSRWFDLNYKSHKVVFLNKNSLNFYLPEFFTKYRSRTGRGFEQLLSLELLKTYGGVWVKPAIYPVYPVDYFYDSVVNFTNFFSYKTAKNFSDFFVCANGVNNEFICEWSRLAKSYVDDRATIPGNYIFSIPFRERANVPVFGHVLDNMKDLHPSHINSSGVKGGVVKSYMYKSCRFSENFPLVSYGV